MLGRLRRVPGLDVSTMREGREFAIGDDLLSAVETRLLWSRFGL